MPEVISRDEARDAGLKFYFTGALCRKGHLAERRVSDTRCKECAKVTNARAYLKNPEDKKARAAAWYAANKERAAATFKRRYESNPQAKISSVKWAKENPEARASLVAKWAKDNPDKVAAARKKWNDANPEAMKTRTRRRRARLKGAEGDHTDKDIEALLNKQNFKCAICSASVKKGKDRQVDHIMPLALGGSNWPENLQILCNFCNRSKGAKDPIVFAQSLGRLF